MYRMNQGFSYYFRLVIERSGSGFRRPKNIRIRRIRFRNTDCRVTSFRRGRWGCWGPCTAPSGSWCSCSGSWSGSPVVMLYVRAQINGIYRIFQCLNGTTLLPSVFCFKKRENKCNSVNLPVSTQSWTTDRYPIALQIPKGLKGTGSLH